MKNIITLLFFYGAGVVQAGVPHHILLKDDFNKDGIADRVLFASNGISGFYQSTGGNHKIDTFYIKQNQRSIFFTSLKESGEPYLKLQEDTGIFSVVSLWRYENKKLNLAASYVLPSRIYFSDDPFSCDSSDPFGSNVTKPAKSFSEELKKQSIKDAVSKAISPDCKKVFGKDYPEMEKQIVSACEIDNSKQEKNNLVNCLDGNQFTRQIGGMYKINLLKILFGDGPTISCERSSKNIPLASFNSSSGSISFFQTTPPLENRNFKADWFHEVLHATFPFESNVKQIVEACLIKSKKEGTKTYQNDAGFQRELEARKDGVEIKVPQKELSAAPVAQAVATAEKTLDNDFSMGNETQYASLAKVSQSTFKAFEPMMAAAYNAALPVAFAANDTIKVEEGSAGARLPAATGAPVAMPLPVAKSNQDFTLLSHGADAAEPVYSMPSLPESQKSARGELGNGMTMTTVPTTLTPSAEIIKQRAAFQNLRTQSQSQSKLAANVPALQDDEAFLQSLTHGKYAEVRAKLNAPPTAKILENRHIQYLDLDRKKVIGSKQPFIILKDLGNGFAIRRVLVE